MAAIVRKPANASARNPSSAFPTSSASSAFSAMTSATWPEEDSTALASASCSGATSGSVSMSLRGTRIRLTSAADQRNVNASKTTTTGIEVTVRRRPPSAGPTKNVRLSIVLVVPLAAVSSSGVRDSLGSSAATAGRNGEATIEVSVARMKIGTGDACIPMSSATHRTSVMRIRSVDTSTVLRGRRSTITEAKGVMSAMSTRRTVPQMPTAATPPMP